MNNHSESAAATGFWKSVMHSPIGDLLRGRVSGMSDVRRYVNGAGLPVPISELVTRVTRRTRLWPHEKMDTARELVAHFRDGLAAGHEAEQLIRQFGDERSASRLIRRSARRKRAWVWRAWSGACRVSGYALILVLLMAGWSVLRYWTLSPNVATNYVAVINARALSHPEDQRAWPLYREAILKLSLLGPMPQRRVRDGAPDGTPPSWDSAELRAYLAKAAPALELVARGARRTSLGYPLAAEVEPELDKAISAMLGGEYHSPAQPSSQARSSNPPLLATLLPHLSPLRRIGVLLADAELSEALDARDPARAERALITSISIGDQLCSEGCGTMVEQIVGLALLSASLGGVERWIAGGPGLAPDEAVVRVIHRLSSFGGSRGLKPDLSLERLMMHDTCQRLYSDNGRGDGVLTREGQRRFAADMGYPALEQLGGTPGSSTLPALGLPEVTAGRAATLSMWDRLYDRVQAACDSPDWHAQCERIDAEEGREHASVYTKVRYPLVGLLTPALTRFVRQFHEASMRRDAAVMAMGAELHRRRHGAYPASPDQLVPELLPRVPLDRYDNQPLRFKQVNGSPVIYSIGRDRTDNGGVFEPGRSGTPSPDLPLWPPTHGDRAGR